MRRTCRAVWNVLLDFLPDLPFLASSAALEASTRGTSRAKKSLSPLADIEWERPASMPYIHGISIEADQLHFLREAASA